jgi:predicted small metal-binding protein
MAGTLKKVECDPKCGFLVRSHDEKEVVDLAIRHAKKSHNMRLSEKDVKKMMSNV